MQLRKESDVPQTQLVYANGKFGRISNPLNINKYGDPFTTTDVDRVE
jgi:hypothetical protein